MNTEDFIHRCAIIKASLRTRAARDVAIEALAEQAKAQPRYISGKLAGWTLADGTTFCRKARYPSHDAALEALIGILLAPIHETSPSATYKCPHCGGWHLTSRKPRAAAKTKAASPGLNPHPGEQPTDRSGTPTDRN